MQLIGDGQIQWAFNVPADQLDRREAPSVMSKPAQTRTTRRPGSVGAMIRRLATETLGEVEQSPSFPSLLVRFSPVAVVHRDLPINSEARFCSNAVTDKRPRHDIAQHRSSYSPVQAARPRQKPLRLTHVIAIPPIRAAYLATSLIVCSALAGHAQVLDTSGVPDGASTYVPIDSWVYPALEGLAAQGYVQTAFSSLRPWTRNECARLTEEAEDQLIDRPAASNARRVLGALATGQLFNWNSFSRA